ncbi:MAG: cysteine desulfurase [Anaerolineae bacterium]|nr:cysteine desulfurase [Anaerolineae bacterium]
MIKRNVYLDHSATTPTDPRVLEAMMPYFSEQYGNASSVHSYGRQAERAIEDARQTIANILNCQPTEIVFTSGGSESDNLAIRGCAMVARAAGKGNHLITTPVEHPAVTRTVQQLVDYSGFISTILPVDEVGQVSPESLESAVHDDTILASIVYANNEIGTLSPLSQLSLITRQYRIAFHTDAVQAGGQMTLNVEELGVDMLSLSAHKFYGPKGIGLLYVRDGIDLIPSQSGGSHERGRRAGTQNTPGIVGMAKALELAYSEHESRIAHFSTMRDQLIDGILSSASHSHLSGHPTDRLPSHASFVFDGVDGNKLLMHLDMKGIAASSGSACKTGNPEPSGVLLALGYDCETALSSLRLTVGTHTTHEDIDYAVKSISESVEALRKLNSTVLH